MQSPKFARSDYHIYDRLQWTELHNTICTQKQLPNSVRPQTSAEFDEIYHPLTTRLHQLIIQHQQAEIKRSPNKKPSPYIIGIAGSVAAGKSTIAHIITTLLRHYSEHPKVEQLTTDGFLYPLAELKQRGILSRKGFPESYDTELLIEFVMRVKAGEANISIPTYSHIRYDRSRDHSQLINSPDILIIEGVNVLQSNKDSSSYSSTLSITDFTDFSIYIDVEESLLKSWYIERFCKLVEGAKNNKTAHFHQYCTFSEQELVQTASHLWESINSPNLRENIRPTMTYADLILQKDNHHSVSSILLRRAR